MNRTTRIAMPMMVVAALALASSLHAASLPYLETFEAAADGNAVPAGFTETNDTVWSVISTGAINGSKSYHAEAGAAADAPGGGTALVDFNGSLGGPAAAASDFAISVTFRPQNVTGSGSVNLGLRALVDAAGNDGYYARILGTGSLRLQKLNSSGGGFDFLGTNDTDQGGFSSGTEYTLSLTGTYNASNQLELFMNVTGGSFTGVGLSAVDASPSANTYVGLRVAAGGNRQVVGDFDDLAVDVPEPATLALLGLGGLLMLKRRD